MTREEWLEAAMKALDQRYFGGAGRPLPENLRVTCGWPYKSPKAIGQCWDPGAAADRATHLFICPSQAEPVRVLDILLHEMIHAHVGIECGHRGAFKKLAREIGLEGKITSTHAEPGTQLHNELTTITTELGPYPHAPIAKDFKKQGRDPSDKPRSWVRLRAVTNEDYTVVISRKLLEEHGPPQGPDGDDMIPMDTETSDD